METFNNIEKIKGSYEKIFSDVGKVLLVVAHPDDMDAAFGGTVARLKEENKDIRVVVCTDGSKGKGNLDISDEKLVQIRKQEQIDSGKELGLMEEDIFFLDNVDGSLSSEDSNLLERIVFHMRDFRPQIILTHEFETKLREMSDGKYAINHKDHIAVGNAVLNCMMPLARDLSFFPEHKDQELEGVFVGKLLLSDRHEGSENIDITDVIGKKEKSLKKHETQFDHQIVDKIVSYSKIQDKYYESFKYYEMGY